MRLLPRPLHAAALTLSLSAATFAWTQTQPRTPASSPDLATLRSGFAHPPAPAKLRCYWWWLNGHTDKPTITHDLEQMKARGFGGALLVDANGSDQNGNTPVPPGPTFGSPAWTELYVHALREADRLGLDITLNITSGWNLGGPDVLPEQASKLLTWTRTDVHGGAPSPVQLAMPEIRNGFYREIAVLAYPLEHGTALAPQPDVRQGDRHTAPPPASPSADRSAQRSAQSLRFRSAAAETGFSMPDASPMLNDGVTGPDAQFAADPGFADTPASAPQDLTSKVDAQGKLSWQPPPGDWEILRIGYTDSGARVSTASGAWQGLAIDYLSHEAFDQYWDRDVEPLLSAAKPFHSLKFLATDSWELGGTNWTGNFREQFLRLRGYDPVPWLPVVAGRIVGNRSQSTRFLNDLRRTVADLIVSEHYDVFAQKARQHGLGVQAESGGPHGAPIDALETFRHAGVPQTEFWSENPHRNTDPERFFTKEAASAANIYGQRFVAQEGETSIGPQWSESLATDLKPSFDMGVTEGMNRLVWHEFTSSPASTGLPGQEYFAGTHLNPKVTWWSAGDAFFDYLNRVQFVMQQGTPVDDVLYFYGDNVPNFVRLKADDPAHALPGYDFDVTDEDALLHTIDLRNGKLRGPSGVTWQMLALPKTDLVSLAVLNRVQALLEAGGVVVSPPPTSTTGITTPQLAARFQTLVHTIWGDACAPESHHAFGKGQVFCTHDTHAVAAALHLLPDASLADGPQTASSTSDFDYAHRRLGDTDIYFVRNGSSHTSNHEVLFRVSGKSPQLWNPVTGQTDLVPQHASLPDGRTQVSLSLPPFGSAFVIFSSATPRPPNPPGPPQTLPLTPLSDWNISFEPGRGAPAAPVQLHDLNSWTESSVPGIRFFSGTATYRAQVTRPAAPQGSEISIAFGDVREIARVRINGKDAGTLWAKPSTLRVDQLLKPGSNTLEIEVTNLWPNRIIGDLQPGTTHRFTETNITAYTAQSPLLPSGLIGPVTWQIDKHK